MPTQQLNIDARHRRMTGFLASLEDFDYTAGDTVNAEVLITNPHISLYCLDDTARQAIFVELPPDVNLAAAPFVYLTQYEHAQRLYAVPYDEFQRAALDLPDVRDLIMVYTLGRSGSTLLSHVLNELPDVTSLAEPDAATQFVHLRAAHRGSEADLRQLLDSTVRFLFKPNPIKTPRTCALKLRNEGTRVMDLYQATFPHARNLYLYRDCIGYATSFYRIFRTGGMPEQNPRDEILQTMRVISGDDTTRWQRYLDPDSQEITLPQFFAVWWLAVIEWYLAQYNAGIPVLAVHYADLNQKRVQVLTEVFRYCGLPTSQVETTLGAFERDAQAGTELAREKPSEGNQLRFTPEQLDEITRVLERHPTIRHSDFVVPGTLPL